MEIIKYCLGNHTYQTYHSIFNLILLPLFPVLINTILLKLLKPNFDYLRKHGNEINQSFLIIIDIILTICCTIQFSSYWIEKYLFNGENPIRNWMIATFLITIVILLRYIGNKTKELDRQRIQELKDNQLSDLTAYVHQMETMYDELRSFRHDYHNVLISLNESIKTKNLGIIEKTYDQILNNEGLKLQETQYSLAKLNNLKTLPVKGVFSTHVITAWQKKIDVHLEIEDVIENEPIDVLDYVRITSILLDNAIEAAEKAEKPSLNIVCFTTVNPSEIYLIIENSCENEQLNIAKIFQSGVSTKGENRGVGLANVNKILKEYPHISLQTESEPFLFRQTLIINKEEQP
ncbi:sensor histidine kinase [Enterococcus sp. LJL99]